METIDKLEKFSYRYLVLNCNTHYEVIKKDFKNIPKPPYGAFNFIFDYKKGEILMFINEKINKSFEVKPKYDISFLNPYKVDDSYFYQIDKISPNMKNIEQMYGIDHVWVACVYISTGGKKRMIINENVFGKFKILNTRDFIIENMLSL
jgi:hypothetical protein